MNAIKTITILITLSLLLIGCKKNTLVEVVDVPDKPMVAIEKKNEKISNLKANEGSIPLNIPAYEYNSLEPYVDATTLELHFTKHLVPYLNALNKSIERTPYANMDLISILKTVTYKENEIKNYAGAVYNHNFYFESITPKANNSPKGELADAIYSDFGTFDNFVKKFTETSVKINGSGWTWLLSDKYGKLRIITTQNNENPLMKEIGIKAVPLLCLDMWEHAYYLKYQNKKREYANTFFSIINWNKIEERYTSFQKVTPKKTITSLPIDSNENQKTEEQTSN